MNIRRIIEIIEKVSRAYPTVQEFGEGDIYSYLNSGEHKYPCVFITVESVSEGEGDTQNMSSTLFYVDRLLSDSSNRLEIQSSSISTLKSITEKINDVMDGSSLISGEYTPFTEKFSDLCAGSFIRFNISVVDGLDCDGYELATLDINENGLYDVLGYSQVLVDITRVRSIDGHTGDITLGDGLTIDENNVLSGTPTQTLEAGTNITITQEGNNYRFDVPDMRYDDSQIKEDIAALDVVEIPTIAATTTNFTSGSKWTITTAFERCANLFEGILTDITNNIKALFPTEASTTNQLADKAFVNSTVAANAANFRGNWATWNDVPTDKNHYPTDYSGKTTPTNNDYLVVQDASGYDSSNTGAWRFKYTGDWNTVGKSGWTPEYRIGSAFTAEQQAAIDSTITSTLVNQYSGYDARITDNRTNKVDKNNTAYKVYGTASDGTQCVYTAGTNVNFNEITTSHEEQQVDDEGNPVVDSEGNPVMITVETKTHNISANGAYEKILQTTETATVNANTYNYWENPVNSLNITLVDGADTNVVNEFVMRFKVGTGFTGITFNKSIRYKGLTPAWTENTTYELSIVDGYCLYSIYFA